MKNAHTVLRGLRKEDVHIDHTHVDVPLQVCHHRTHEALDLTQFTRSCRVCLAYWVPWGKWNEYD